MAERLTLSAFTSQGFARCTSDGVFNATIWDVVVCPKWQGCGLGKAMVERLTQKLIQLDIQNVSLYAEPAVVGLYQKCGFEGTCCVFHQIPPRLFAHTRTRRDHYHYYLC
jgi:ribosomal protein S18 acetylase RimI-like enzyme